MGVWLSGGNGQDTNLSNLSRKFQNFVCVGAENTVFSHMRAKMAKFSFAPVSVFGPKFARNYVLVGGMLGWWCFLFLFVFLATSLGPKSSLCLLVRFWAFWVFLGGAFCLVWFLFVFCYEKIRQTYFFLKFGCFGLFFSVSFSFSP